MRFTALRFLTSLFLLCGLLQLALAQDGRGTSLAPSESEEVRKGNRYALLIGVQNYQKGIRPLQYTQNDVRALYDALVDPRYGAFPRDNVVVLADDWNEKPTSAEINKKLNWLQIVAKNPEDLVLIYFSGHGDSKGETSYLLTLDTDPDALDLTGLSVEIFNRLVKEIPARKKIIFLDSCHSGGISLAARGESGPMSSAAFRQLHENSEGEVRLLSCRQGELSYETEKLGNGRGVFSHFLVEAITSSEADVDGNGFTTASEVEDYVTLKVQNWAAKQGWRQTPVAEKRVSGKMILSGTGLARTSGPVAAVRPAVETTDDEQVLLTALKAYEEKKWDECLPVLRQFASKGHSVAQVKLGRLYQQGFGVSRDPGQAVQWYRKAADQGNPEAQSALASCYGNGVGVGKDNVEALRWWRKAADQGDAHAQMAVGVHYQYGVGVGEDRAQAVQWFRKSAEQGYAMAENQLGECYRYGNGVSADQGESARWYLKAAEQGYADAQFILGSYYENGIGVGKDRAEAAKWYGKAADGGHPTAEEALRRLSE